MPKRLFVGLITMPNNPEQFSNLDVYSTSVNFFLNTRFFDFLILQPRSEPGVQARASKTQNSPENAARERSRVRNLRQAFQSLQAALPSVPPDTKLSKLDVLVLATNYIAHLTETLDQGGAVCDHPALHRAEGYLHPVKVSFTQNLYILLYRHEKIFNVIFYFRNMPQRLFCASFILSNFWFCNCNMDCDSVWQFYILETIVSLLIATSKKCKWNGDHIVFLLHWNNCTFFIKLKIASLLLPT